MKSNLNIMKSNCVLTLLCCSFLISCDPVTTYRKVLKNESKHTLMIKQYTRAGSLMPYELLKTYSVNPDMELILSNSSYMGDAQPCVVSGDSLDVSISEHDNLRIDFDINNSISWERSKFGSTFGNSRKRVTYCKAVVTNADIISK